MANTTKTGVKILKDVIKKIVTGINPPTGTAVGYVLDAAEKPVLQFVDKIKFDNEYENIIRREYPDDYDAIFCNVQKIISSTKDIDSVLVAEEFDFGNTANQLIEDGLSETDKAQLSDELKSGIRTGLHCAIGWAYKLMSNPENEEVYKWVLNQTARNKNNIEKITNQIESINFEIREVKEQVGIHEVRIGNLENKNSKDPYECVDIFKKRWNNDLFLEVNKDKQEDKKRLSDIYVIPQVQNIKTGKFESLDKFIKEDTENFTLFLGQPGVGKSTMISAYLNERFGQCDNCCSVFKFSDFANCQDWSNQSEKSLAANFLKEIGVRTPLGLKDRTIFLDGFDEISVLEEKKVELLSVLKNWQEAEGVENSKIIVTCRTNYMDKGVIIDKGINAVEIQPFSEEQIQVFYKNYAKDTEETTINNLKRYKDIYGYPVVLYMVLSTNGFEKDAKNIVTVYKSLFSKVYKRSWECQNQNNGHLFTTQYEIFYNRLAQKMAVYMFEHNDGAEGCPSQEVQKFGKELKDELGVPLDVPNLIAGFYSTNITENENNVYFVHRTIYEYFYVSYLVETVNENMGGADHNWFVRRFCEALQYHRMSDKRRKDFFDYAGEDKDQIIGTIKAELEKALDQEQLSTEPKYLQRSKYETYVLVNCLNMISKSSKAGKNWSVDSKNLADYLRFAQHNSTKTYYLLNKVNLKGANLNRAFLSGSNLKGANLKGADLLGAELDYSYLKYAILIRANLEFAFLRHARLDGSDIAFASLSNAYLEGAVLRGANLECAVLTEANLSYADLKDVKLKRANLKGANLEGANLEGANLEGANLEGANLKDANLKGALLEGANLKGTLLEGANLEDAHLKWTNLEGAHLEGALLEGVNLSGSLLEGTNLERKRLKCAHLEKDLE